MRKLLLATLIFFAGGCGAGSFLITPVQNVNVLQETVAQPGTSRWKSGKIALIEVEGMLINSKNSSLLGSTENPLSLFAQQLDRAAKDEDVKALVLRINSPGGTVSSSDAMYELLTRFKKKTNKPIVASMQEVAASGGYYVALASDRIVAQPTSVVGSIGVIFTTFNFGGTLYKIGAQAESIKSGPLKDMGSMYKELTPEERAVMQGMVDEYYQRFVNVVQKHRRISDPETLKITTDGRVFSGARAKELGLIDDVGLLEDALDLARKLGKVPGAKVVMYKRPHGYKGSIYADNSIPQPQSNIHKIELPGGPMLPGGFYYLWNP
jgi:protease-4